MLVKPLHAALLYRPPKNTAAGSLCIFNSNVTASQSGLYPILHARHYPHIVPNYPRAHYNAGLNTSAAVCRRRYLVSVRNLSIRCACNQTRVCRRKCSGWRLPNESVPTEGFWPAASDGRVLAGGFRRKCSVRWLPVLYITSANSAFAAFFKSSGFRVSWTPILPPLTTILSRDAAPASIRVTYCFFMPMAVQPPRT